MAKKRFPFMVVLFAAVIIIIGGSGYLLFRYVSGDKPFDTEKIQIKTNGQTGSAGKQQITVYLYFSDEKNTFLVAEDRTLFQTDDPIEIGRAICDGLIQGPQGRLLPTIPKGTSLNAFYVSTDGTAFIDFSDTIREKHPGGSQTELLTIYSIVNSIVLNMTQVQRVKILIEGREAMTLAGHIDIRSPFTADMILVR